MTLHPTLLVYVSTVVPALKPVKVVPVITPTAVLDEIQGKVEQLPAHPKRCRPGRVNGTRELVVRPNYIVIYAETPAVVTVLRVLHAAQMWP